MENNLTTKQSKLELAEALSKSVFIPDIFKNKPGDCLVAIDIAERTGLSPVLILQNTQVIRGNACFKSPFLIALINSSKKFKHDLRFRFSGSVKDGTRSCIAWTRYDDGEIVEGTEITLAMAKQENWGSKWSTIPDQMLMYRSASFFARVYCPEISTALGGLQMEELEDITEKDITPIDINTVLSDLANCKSEIEVETVRKRYKGRFQGEPAKQLKQAFAEKLEELKNE